MPYYVGDLKGDPNNVVAEVEVRLFRRERSEENQQHQESHGVAGRLLSIALHRLPERCSRCSTSWPWHTVCRAIRA